MNYFKLDLFEKYTCDLKQLNLAKECGVGLFAFHTPTSIAYPIAINIFLCILPK